MTKNTVTGKEIEAFELVRNSGATKQIDYAYYGTIADAKMLDVKRGLSLESLTEPSIMNKLTLFPLRRVLERAIVDVIIEQFELSELKELNFYYRSEIVQARMQVDALKEELSIVYDYSGIKPTDEPTFVETEKKILEAFERIPETQAIRKWDDFASRTIPKMIESLIGFYRVAEIFAFTGDRQPIVAELEKHFLKR